MGTASGGQVINEDPIVDEAARWMVQLLDDPDTSVLSEFAGWLLRSDAHVRAHLRLSRLWLITDPAHPPPSADELLDILRERLPRLARPTTSV